MDLEFISKVFGIEFLKPQKTVIFFLTIFNVGLLKQLANRLKQHQKLHHGLNIYEIKIYSIIFK